MASMDFGACMVASSLKAMARARAKGGMVAATMPGSRQPRPCARPRRMHHRKEAAGAVPAARRQAQSEKSLRTGPAAKTTAAGLARSSASRSLLPHGVEERPTRRDFDGYALESLDGDWARAGRLHIAEHPADVALATPCSRRMRAHQERRRCLSEIRQGRCARLEDRPDAMSDQRHRSSRVCSFANRNRQPAHRNVVPRHRLGHVG